MAMRRGVWGAISPNFCQDDVRDFLKIDEQIGGGRG